MATTVVSGRIDEHIKREVAQIIARVGKTPGDVVRDVWASIYQTGKLPDVLGQEELLDGKCQGLREFLEFVDAAPVAPDWFIGLDDRKMNDMIAEGHMSKRDHV